MSVLGASASSAVQSGAEELERGLSSGVQEWETDESQWPLTQPVQKYEGKIQCAGEAEYTNDRPKVFGELHAAFVLTTKANCDIAAINKEHALVSWTKCLLDLK